ncbi:uncharacterized protein LOC120258980 isoform X2 [Dioscorea cayenensis subsp. rotundata]|uniref:Uncharacterized protein LOC120258980 isoform X2 n=1 Tax=Dioscorea cayennensis subsp. rotundata TaxID=55577 RepID=A0AB40B5A1_DIOCR|nr:uncharacterized protein LOC120258980 isoform X2 [Dioscorea cayenensis subsp. rotundata]
MFITIVLKLCITSLMGNRSSLRKHDMLGIESVLVDIFVLSFKDKILNFEEFCEAFLDICSKLNSIMPGRHFCVPLQEVKLCYEEWKDSNSGLDEEEKKNLIIRLLNEHAVINHTNDSVLMTGLITPPVAMIFKRLVPDFIFVPAVTVIAVIVAKMIQNIKQNDNVAYEFQSSSPQKH